MCYGGVGDNDTITQESIVFTCVVEGRRPRDYNTEAINSFYLCCGGGGDQEIITLELLIYFTCVVEGLETKI